MHSFLTFILLFASHQHRRRSPLELFDAVRGVVHRVIHTLIVHRFLHSITIHFICTTTGGGPPLELFDVVRGVVLNKLQDIFVAKFVPSKEYADWLAVFKQV
jgi:hypothetical protein